MQYVGLWKASNKVYSLSVALFPSESRSTTIQPLHMGFISHIAWVKALAIVTRGQGSPKVGPFDSLPSIIYIHIHTYVYILYICILLYQQVPVASIAPITTVTSCIPVLICMDAIAIFVMVLINTCLVLNSTSYTS